MRAARKQTPVRAALQPGSPLHPKVVDGLGAVKAADRSHFEEAVPTLFADSLDLDAALSSIHPDDNRWDYLLGHAPSLAIVGVEPHSAKDDEVQRVISKRRAALLQLRVHLGQGVVVRDWLWVTTRDRFADTEKTRRLLDQNGIRFVGTAIGARHLPPAAEAPSSSGARRRVRGRRDK